MLRRMRKDYLLDLVHRTFVYTCMGFTLAAGSWISVKTVEYFAILRPARREAEKIVKRKLLLESEANT